MMNFKQFLLKESWFDKLSEEEVNTLIQKNCQPFLKDSKGQKLLRGMEFDYFVRYGKARARTGTKRDPKGMSPQEKETLNKAIENVYGLPKVRDRALFCSGDLRNVERFGDVYEIYPIGNSYTFLWSPKIKDINENFYFTKEADKVDTHNVEVIENFLNQNDYTNQNLEKAIKSGNEIMLLCDIYYFKIVEKSLKVPI